MLHQVIELGQCGVVEGGTRGYVLAEFLKNQNLIGQKRQKLDSLTPEMLNKFNKFIRVPVDFVWIFKKNSLGH